jgi:hypothetical protein
MSMRIFSAFAAFVVLAGCSSGPEDGIPESDPLIEAETQARAELAENGMIYCALEGAPNFRPDCQIEQTQGNDGIILTLRHPDGGFRRLLVTRDGRGLIAADGAEPAIVNSVSEREIEVAISFDRYRLPATVR